MKNDAATVLLNILNQIAKAANAEPGKFTIGLKLAVSENRRILAPFVGDCETERASLVKRYGEPQYTPPLKEGEDRKPDAYEVRADSKNFKKFSEEYEKLMSHKFNVKLRRIYEGDLEEAPLTVDQLSVLGHQGVLILKPVENEPTKE